MKKAFVLSVALVLAAAFASAGTNKGVAHARASHGTVQSLDAASKSFVLRTGDKEMKVTWNDATHITGGQLKDGEQVELRSVEKDGTHVATAIQIEPLKPAKATN